MASTMVVYGAWALQSIASCITNNLEKEKHMCLISEKDKEPSMLYYFKDATFNVDNVCCVFLLGEVLAGFIF